MNLEPVDPFTWRVPVGTVPGMRVPGIVFATEEMARRAVEDRAVEQVAAVATLPGIVEASYAMPDIHWGYGFPIGGVAATDAEADGVVSPGGVGFDIACGVRLIRTALDWESEGREHARPLVHTLGQRVPRGIGQKGRMRLSRGEAEKVLRVGPPNLAAWARGTTSWRFRRWRRSSMTGPPRRWASAAARCA